MSEAQTPRDAQTTDESGEWSDEEIAAAKRLAQKYGDEDPLGQLCERIAQSADSDDPSEEARS